MSRHRLYNLSGVAVSVIILLLMPQILSGNQYWISVLALATINILLVSSLRAITLINQISLGQVGFALIGSYGSAILMLKAGLPFWLTLFLGGVMAATVALILGYPFLKVKGIYFSILTLLTAETFRLVAYYWRDVTGGTLGLVKIPSPDPITLPLIGTIYFDKISGYYYIAIVVVLLCLLILYLIEHSHINFKWRAIKDADELASSIGINVIWYKMMNFIIASFFAGISGALFAHYQHNLSADITSRFAVTTSIYLLVYMVVGGHKSFFGPIVGTLVLTYITEVARPLRSYQPMIIGSIAILVMIFMPLGLAGLPSQIRNWIQQRKNPRQIGQTGQEPYEKTIPPPR